MTVRSAADLGKVHLGDVQETLLTPLCARSNQLTRSDAILIDEAAGQIVDSIDYEFEKIQQYPDTLTGCAIRAAVMDRWIREFLASSPRGAIGLLGIGLDTVFERNDNGCASWFELDFPDVIELRRQCFEDAPRRHLISGSVLDRAWIEQVKAKSSGPWLFQAAGLLMYLQPDQVRDLFDMLAQHFPGAIFLFDGCSRLAKANSHRWEATVRTTNASYHWAIDDPSEISTWNSKVEITDTEYMMDHHRNQWRLRTRFWSRILPKLRKAYHINRAVLAD